EPSRRSAARAARRPAGGGGTCAGDRPRRARRGVQPHREEDDVHRVQRSAEHRRSRSSRRDPRADPPAARPWPVRGAGARPPRGGLRREHPRLPEGGGVQRPGLRGARRRARDAARARRLPAAAVEAQPRRGFERRRPTARPAEQLRPRATRRRAGPVRNV
ncbi:MAG: hypothetical protein AVDCRST_MAG53-1665, partial [uncultured Solirubrobacteraceae bacterium]